MDTVWSSEIAEFKKAMQKVSRKIAGYDGTITWEIYWEVSRIQDIDVLQFYDDYYQLFPCRKVLGTNATSTSCERIFYYAGIILNCRRTPLTTDIADNKIIASACKQRNNIRNSKFNSS